MNQRQKTLNKALDYASRAPEGITGNRQLAAALVKAIKQKQS